MEAEKEEREEKQQPKKRKAQVLFLSIGVLFIVVGLILRVFDSPVELAEATTPKTSLSSASQTSMTEIEKTSIDDWRLLLVNIDNPLPVNYEPKLKVMNNQSVDERVYSPLKEMLNGAANEGLSPVVCSSYRSIAEQTKLYDEQIELYKQQGNSEEEAKQKTETWLAVPGTSEHHTGMSVDIVAYSYQILDGKQADTKETKWLMENCHKYGFVLRYPTEKSDITKIGYEPWHYRYVGVEAASQMKEKNLCLEEYLKQL